jgi:squalene synthase HpnC
VTAIAGSGLPAPAAARARRENFPVALALLSRAQRTHLMALYGFARLADDLGDEAEGDRLALLDELDADLGRVFAGREPLHPVLQSLAPTVRALRLPEPPFRRLIEANRRDQRVSRYATWAELRGYCALSANPVGHLVLHVFGAATPERFPASDAVCTALQLVEHCQDVAEDLARGRLYLPAEDLARFGCQERDLCAPAAGPGVRGLLRFEVGLARCAPIAALPWCARSRPGAPGDRRIRRGGRAAADAIERRGFDVLGGALRPRRRDLLRRLVMALR